MTLPGAPYLARAAAAPSGELQLEGCSLDALARRFGTPLFVYSRNAMLDAAAAYRSALGRRPHLLCYAMKANSSLAVLQTMAQAGCGFDIVSGGELERVLAIGTDPSQVVFSGVGKTRAEMARALEVGVRCFNVESQAELEVLSTQAVAAQRIAKVSLRINPDVDARTHPYISTGLKGNKFGIAHGQALASYRRAAELPGLKVVGIDCHIGSQITQIAPYIDALDRLLDLIEAVEAEGIVIDHLDLGGGLGIDYSGEAPPRPEELVARLVQHIDARGHGHRELMFEPGRSLVGNAGVLLTEVLYLKPGPKEVGEDSAKNFCIVDAAMNDLMRPALYQSWMAIEPCRPHDGPVSTWDVVGPVCESGDWLGRDRALALQPGDVLAVLSAGAYAMAMASNYNSRARAAEVMIVDGQPLLIREREAVADLWKHERLLP
jgi:diaminopimelate decarboxylase